MGVLPTNKGFVDDFGNKTFQVQSRIASAGISTVTIGPFFRVIEAMYGTSPAYVTKSLSNYVGYMSSVVPYVWDPKTESRAKILPTRLTEKFLRVMGGFILLSTTLSFLKQYDYKPFPTTVEIDQTELTWELLSFNHIINAYLCAWLVFGTLMAGFEGTSIGENAKGFDTHHLFHSPFFQSRSPTEFWTKRWDILLKHGIFLPSKQFLSTKVSVFITFLVSGLYHDYVWYCIFYDIKDADGKCLNDMPCYDHQFGRVTLFFAYVGILMLLERPMSKWGPIQWLSQRLPTSVIAYFLLLLHIPIAHWYYGDWIRGGYYDHFAIALWQVKRIG